jgi:Holliday junction resolvase RusA-like endonuclease
MTFFIHGDPKGQPRPRAFARKMGAKYVARVYDSDVADEWKRAVDLAIVAAFLASNLGIGRQESHHKSTFEVVATFWMRRPKSHFNAHGFVKPSSPVRHAQKPDADNLVKLVLDRITRSELIWRDDSQVAYLTVAKYWADKDENVGCNLTLQPILPQ